MARTLALAALALLALAGCGAGDKTAQSSAEKPKGANLRLLNLSDSRADVVLNDQSMGQPLESGTATPFRLMAPKGPASMTVNGSHSFDVPLAAGEATTVVYLGNNEPVLVTGEPTAATKTKCAVYYHVLTEGHDGKLSVESSGGNVELGKTESKEVSPGSFVAKTKLSGGKEVSASFDVEEGDVVSVMLVKDGSSAKLIVLRNNNKMIVTGFGGSSPTG